MKGLEDFLKALKEDKKLFSEVEKVQDNSAKVVEIAKVHGYNFTENEYNDLKMEAVSGGTGGENIDLGSLINQGLNAAGNYITSEEGKEKGTGLMDKVGELLKNFGNKENKS